jgi:Zn ribbon nucleic-acid-binding protein
MSEEVYAEGNLSELLRAAALAFQADHACPQDSTQVCIHYCPEHQVARVSCPRCGEDEAWMEFQIQWVYDFTEVH